MNKTKISVNEFNKKVEMEAAYLVYIDRLKQEKAQEKAHETVSQKFEVDQSLN